MCSRRVRFLPPATVLFIPRSLCCRYHQVHGIADESGRSLAVNYWQESIFGWSLADDIDHATRETAIRTQLPVRNDMFAPAPWEGFLD